MSRLAPLIVRLAARLLPAPAREWGRAMAAELAAIERPWPALGFALGCLAAALREAVRFQIMRVFGAVTEGDGTMGVSSGFGWRPRRLAGWCAAGAAGLGLAYMTLAGAPLRYPAVNLIALALGFGAVALLSRVGDVRRGLVDLMLAGVLLMTALWGLSAGGMTRWLAVGGVLLQPGLILLPILTLRFARNRDPLSTLAIALAALALALQPDRAMAGALAAGMAVLAVLRPERNALLAFAAAATGFAATMIRADPSAAMPFVDQVLATSFAVHPLAGMAAWTGAALLLVPAFAGLVRRDGDKLSLAVFGGLWFAVILAAVLGNYPTPFVGHGASPILGYVLSLLGLPGQARVAAAAQEDDDRPRAEPDSPQVFRAYPA